MNGYAWDWNIGSTHFFLTQLQGWRKVKIFFGGKGGGNSNTPSDKKVYRGVLPPHRKRHAAGKIKILSQNF